MAASSDMPRLLNPLICPEVPKRRRQPVKRAKAPRKRPKTITAAATAAYQVSKEPESNNAECDQPHNDAAPTPTALSGLCPRKKKERKRPKKAAKVEPSLPKLYSPTRAAAQAESQQFLFGTSSQLAVDESPSFICETLTAIRESEGPCGSQPGETPVGKSYQTGSTAPHGTNLSIRRAERDLWSGATRNLEGGVLRENLGLNKRRLQKKHLERAGAQYGDRTTTPGLSNTNLEIGGSQVPGERHPAAPTADERIAEDGFMLLQSSSPDPALPPPEKQPLRPKGPNSRLTFRSSPEKPTPRRARPAKKQAISPIEIPATDEEDSFINIDDISDPEPPSTPSPPRRRASASPQPLRPLDFSPTVTRTTTTDKTIPTCEPLSAREQLKKDDAHWPSIQQTLFPQITASVKMAPRSTDPAKPSWHQKILLYDPIVLEDFTAWLNDQNLRVSVQRRKAKAANRASKKGLNDGGRNKATASGGACRDGTEEIQTVREELQPWMVQNWCEERSLCCLWKEGPRGIKSRY